MDTRNLPISQADGTPTAPLSAPTHPRPPAYPRWLIGVIVLGVVGTVAFFAFGTLAITKRLQQEQKYIHIFSGWNTRYEVALAQVDALIANPRKDDRLWQQNLHEQFVKINGVGADIRAYHPGFMGDVWHDSVIADVANQYDLFADWYEQAYPTNSQPTLDNALAARKHADQYRQHDLGTFGLKK